MICGNYRGISLLSIPSKVYTRILDGMVRSRTEGIRLWRCRVALNGKKKLHKRLHD